MHTFTLYLRCSVNLAIWVGEWQIKYKFFIITVPNIVEERLWIGFVWQSDSPNTNSRTCIWIPM